MWCDVIRSGNYPVADGCIWEYLKYFEALGQSVTDVTGTEAATNDYVN